MFYMMYIASRAIMYVSLSVACLVGGDGERVSCVGYRDECMREPA